MNRESRNQRGDTRLLTEVSPATTFLRRLTIAIVILGFLPTIQTSFSFQPKLFGQDVQPLLTRAHAHNDYYHKRPLLDALDQGFCSVEADVFFRKGELVVAHTFLEIRADRTLKKLYLDPLFERVNSNKGSVYPKREPFLLLVDFKSNPNETLKALEAQLKPYRRQLTRLENDEVITGAVTVVISGNRPTQKIISAKNRFLFLDGRLSDPASWSTKISPVISESWNTHFRYRGIGEIKKEERLKLNSIIEKVHKQKKRIRFWALPDRKNAWRVAFESGVDLINTDKLAELRQFLISRK